MISLINSCDFLNKNFNCKICKRKEIYGPAIENSPINSFLDNNSTNLTCYFSNNQNLNCIYRDDMKSLRRVCPCV
jgi:hypothetical protein